MIWGAKIINRFASYYIPNNKNQKMKILNNIAQVRLEKPYFVTSL